jgi:hypothetical protein
MTPEVYTRTLGDVPAAPVQRYLRDLGPLLHSSLSCRLAASEVSAGFPPLQLLHLRVSRRASLRQRDHRFFRTASPVSLNVGTGL